MRRSIHPILNFFNQLHLVEILAESQGAVKFIKNIDDGLVPARIENMSESKKVSKKFNFEKALEELEEIVSRLDSGELGLEEMLEEFERGIKLVRSCQKFLEQAQKKVEMLIADSEKLEFKELEEED